MLIMQKKIQSDNGLFFIIKVYYKIFITIILSLMFLSFPNYSSIISNINILCLLILALYLNNIISIIKKIVYAINHKDISGLFESFIKTD